jgi:acetyltransferase-like isoleucine patch superfamily enzyme
LNEKKARDMKEKLVFWYRHPIRGVLTLFAFIYSFFIGHLFYDPKYLKGKWFNSPGAIGWQWVRRGFFLQKILGINRSVPWPVSGYIRIGDFSNIEFSNNDLNNFQSIGNYFQGIGAKIIIGEGTYIAPNVGIITENHDVNDPDKRMEAKAVKIGEKCWIGMNCVILPGVDLGPHTVVGAGSVVTKSFPDGYCLLAGVPAIQKRTFKKDETISSYN